VSRDQQRRVTRLDSSNNNNCMWAEAPCRRRPSTRAVLRLLRPLPRRRVAYQARTQEVREQCSLEAASAPTRTPVAPPRPPHRCTSETRAAVHAAKDPRQFLLQRMEARLAAAGLVAAASASLPFLHHRPRTRRPRWLFRRRAHQQRRRSEDPPQEPVVQAQSAPALPYVGTAALL
jgi:hypothetical protein